jgi:uncharacterized protein YjiS (DUF1127 family)
LRQLRLAKQSRGHTATSTINGTTGPASAKRPVYSPLETYWNAFQGWRNRERLRTQLYRLTDSELIDIGITRGETTSPRIEVSIREASDLPNERPMSGNWWGAGIGHDQMHHCPEADAGMGQKPASPKRRENLLAIRDLVHLVYAYRCRRRGVHGNDQHGVRSCPLY